MSVKNQRLSLWDAAPSFDLFAFAKGWMVTVGLWLVCSLVLAVCFDVIREKEPNTSYIENLSMWPIFAAVSLGVAMFLGLPLALVLDRLLRRVRSPWIQMAVFFSFFTLLPTTAIGLTLGGWTFALVFFSALGLCAALGRASAYSREDFRRAATIA